MTVPSVKLTLDREYELRFEQDDVIACEDEMKIGYIFFFRTEKMGGYFIPVALSFKLLRSLIHRGLKLRDNRGDFVYALPQSSDGAKIAGNLIQKFKQRGGQDIEIWEKCKLAFSDWFETPKEGAQPQPFPQGDDGKNSHGAL